MSFDVERVRKSFPALAHGAAHFDGPGGSQVPSQVADAIAEALVSPIANRGSVTTAEQNADGIVLGARQAIADLVGGPAGGVVFGPIDDAADVRHGPCARQAVGAGGRGRRHPARPRRQHPPVGAGS
jgi:hypothetical protein